MGGGRRAAAIARSRADENRVFLIVVTTAGDWVVYGPTERP